ncbi:coatomer subunit gamma [Saccharomycopsis crataegensis]|uniref:Coatomer subunit gamma n=1 Tax=Saccharomycopsis crataegensis TaxID=43959 RepID=A0AAV5QUP4_9ASCO|nr:coatomer subunit gamma [Saccharomycopsis crataegensis]
MSTLTYKKFDEGEGVLPDKMTIYQDCISAFNASPVNAKKCRILLAKLVRLLSIGETFPANEATNLFFSISKLFQHKSVELRQIVYLAIKKLCHISNDVLMVTSSIMKDIQNGDIIYKPNAIRTLARVLDSSTVHATERLFKNCIVDKNPNVSSAALVSSYHLSPESKDVVKRWANETQEAVYAQKYFPDTQFQNVHQEFYSRFPSSTQFSQYHALGLLYVLRNHDKMALVKMVNQLSGSSSPLTNPLAIIQVIRYISKLIEEDPSLADHLYPYLLTWTTNKSEMVCLESAKIILNYKKFSPEQHTEAISVLRDLLNAPRVVTIFAAVRMLNKIAMTNPEKVVVCNYELESLINHSNRSIATYAITTLLKTGSADTVDRLIKTISTFMNDISDEFKVVVIDAIRNLTLKFPEKYKPMLVFLSDVLRDEGGFKFKNTVVESLFDMIHYIPESRDSALENLCEFIEDCEYPELTVRILHLLGDEGPKTKNPTLYIRHIYNRIALENSIVRASAVVALSKFALTEDLSLKKSIEVLLQRSLTDSDDEVRDRAAVSLKLLSSSTDKTSSVILVDFIKPTKKYSLPILEQKLTQYISSSDKASYENPFDISSVPQYTEEEWKAQEYKAKTTVQASEEEPLSDHKGRSGLAGGATETHNETQQAELLQQQYIDEISQITELSEYGPILHSSSVVELTERETEFVVSVVKHIFKEHLVLQFNIENTLTDSELMMVSVISEGEVYQEEFILPVEKLAPRSKGTLYVSFARPEDEETGAPGLFSDTLSNTLSFTSREVDPTTLLPFDEEDEGYQDEYQIEELEVTIGDFIVPSFTADFDKTFAELPSENEEVAVFNLSSSSELQEAVNSVINVLSMSALGNTETVGFSANNHKLKVYGKSINGERIAGLINFVISKNGIVAKATVRSDNKALSETVVNGIA